MYSFLESLTITSFYLFNRERSFESITLINEETMATLLPPGKKKTKNSIRYKCYNISNNIGENEICISKDFEGPYCGLIPIGN